MFISEEKILHHICSKNEFNHYVGEDENITEKRLLDRLCQEGKITLISEDSAQQWYLPTNIGRLRDLEYKVNYRIAAKLNMPHWISVKLGNLINSFYQDNDYVNYARCLNLQKKVDKK